MPEGALKDAAKHVEHMKAAVRSKVEHPFRVIKRQFGYQKVRFKGLAKNTAQILTLFALSNLWMARRILLTPAGDVRPCSGKSPRHGAKSAMYGVMQAGWARFFTSDRHASLPDVWMAI